MVLKASIFARLIPLFLCLVAHPTLAEKDTEESTVLFDSEEGIDETQSQAVKDMQALSESLKNIQENEDTDGDSDETPDTNEKSEDNKSLEDETTEEPKTTKADELTPADTIPEEPFVEEAQTPAEAESIPEEPFVEETPTPAKAESISSDTQGTVLFDSEQGIDETQSPAVKKMQELSESLKNIDTSKPVEATETEENTDNTSITENEEIPTEDPEQPLPLETTPVVAEPEETITEEIPIAETPVDEELATDSMKPASEGTVLIDADKGIDETQSPATKQMQELSESLKNMDVDQQQDQSEPGEKIIEDTEQTTPIETRPVDATPVITSPEQPVPEAPEVEADTTLADEIEQDEPVESIPVESIPVIAIPEEPATEAPIAEAPIPEEANPDLLPPAEEGTVLIDTERGIDEFQNPAIKEMRELSESFEDIGEDKQNLPAEVAPVIATPVIEKPAPAPAPAPEPVARKKPAPVIIEGAERETNIGQWTPVDEDLRILEIRVESYRFDDVVDAYQYEDVVLLPLGLITSLLDISIDVEPELAKGFIINEQNTFVLDLKRDQVFIKGIHKKYDNELVRTLAGDIYVDSNLLGRWLGIDFNIDLFASRIWVNSKIKLPFLARIEREQRIKSTLARLNNVTEENYPRHYEPYKNSAVPFIDQTIQVGQRFSDTGNTTSFQYITHATADLIKHESSWYLAGDDQEAARDFRVRFGRTDPDGELLGALNANEYSFGYVAEPRVNLISIPGKMKPGISASNFPIGRQSEYDRHRFRGELLPGWEVEIYRNNALIGYQQTAVEGQYDFQDIPLLFGNNHFRLVFYGQKGEVREENIHFLLTQSLTQQGKHYYSASSTTDDIGSNRTSAQYDYGISKNLSSTFNLVSIPLQESTEIVQHNYLKAGLAGFWDALFASVDVIDDSAGGSAIELDLQTRAGDTVFGFNDITLNKFFSEEYLPSSIEVTHSRSLSINTAIPPFLLPRIPVTIGYKIDEFITGDERVEFTNLLSTNARGFAISNQLISQKTTGQETIQNGIFQLSTNIKDIRIRNIISYSLKPTKELTNVALTIDPGQYEDYRLSFGLNHSLQQDLTEYSVTANKLSGKYNLGLGARYNSNGDINLDLSFSVGFGYEPRRKQWQQEATALANNGSVSARVFLDSDQDGLFGKNDTPLEKVGFRINGGYNKLRTNEEGIAFLTGITAHQPTNIVVAPETMTDPLWSVALDGVRIVPRPGHAIQLDFPVFMSGEADGTVYLNKNGKLVGVGNTTVELVDSIGQVINTTETSYDGFYIMSHIPIGKHWLRISKKQLDKLNIESPDDEGIEITVDDPYVNGIDFTLTQ